MNRAAVGTLGPALALAAAVVLDRTVLVPLGAGTLAAAATLLAWLGGRRATTWMAALAAIALLARDVWPRFSPSPGPAAPALESVLADAERELDQLLARATTALAGSPGPAAAFQALSSIELGPGLGVSLLDGTRPVAWAGVTRPSTSAGRCPELWLEPSPLAVLRCRELGARRVDARLELGPRLGAAEPRVVAASRVEAMALLRASPPEATRLVLRLPDGTPWAVLEPAPSPLPVAARAELADASTVALALALATCWLAATRRVMQGAAPTSEAVVAAGAAAMARLALLSLPSLARLGPFAPRTLAISAPLDLLASAGDLALTGFAAAAMALPLSVRLHPPPRAAMPAGTLPAALAGLGGLALLSAAAAAAHHRLLLRACRNSSLDLADFSLWPWDPTRLAAVVGLTLLALAVSLVLAAATTAALGRLAARLGGTLASAVATLTWTAAALALALAAEARPGLAAAPGTLHALTLVAALLLSRRDRAFGWRALLFAIAAGAALSASATSASREALRGFLANELAQRLLGQEERMRTILNAMLSDLQGRGGRALAGRQPEDIAWQVWKASPLPREGFRAAIEARAPDGSEGRFSHRLALPTSVRPVEGPRLVHQEVVHHGRAQRLLAGQALLSDGTAVTIRMAVDEEGLPFFSDVHSPREALGGSGAAPLELLRRNQVELTVTDTTGRLLHPLSTRAVPVPEPVARAVDDSLRWWHAGTAAGELEVLSFGRGERVLHLSRPVLPLDARIAAGLHAGLLAGLLAAGAGLVLAMLAPERLQLRDRARAALAGYHRKVLASFVLAATVPAIPATLYLRASVERDKLAALREQSLAALELGRRILVELELDAAGVRLDDSALIWLSETVGHELAIYRDGELVATSVRDLFRDDLLARRADPEAWRAVRVDGGASHVRVSRRGDPIGLVVSTSIGDQSLLALYAVTYQSDIERAAAERERTLFLVSAALVMASALLAPWVARRATAPLRALEEGAARIARGDLDVRIEARHRDELGELIRGFNRMASELQGQRRALAEQTAWLELLVTNATTGIVSLGPDGRVTTANPAARAMLETPLEPGTPLAPALAGSDLAALASCLERPGASERGELELLRPGPPAERTLRAVIVPLPGPSGAGSGQLVLLEDVTGIVRSKKLDAWAEMARRVAHEIKNPLTPIQLAAEHGRRLLQDRREGFEAVLARCLETILRQVSDLRRIAREFSVYGAPPARLEPVRVELGAWLDDLLQPYRDAAPPGIGISLAVDPALAWTFDPARLRRALINLLENAIQAMPGGGTIELSARELAGRELEIVVADGGPGIPAELLPRLFDPYFSTRDAGTGLGLANARRVVEEHGGTIAVAESSAKGTRIAIRLPAATPL